MLRQGFRRLIASYPGSTVIRAVLFFFFSFGFVSLQSMECMCMLLLLLLNSGCPEVCVMSILCC